MRIIGFVLFIIFALKDVKNCVEIQITGLQTNFSFQFKVKCGDDLQFKVPVGWEKVECKTMLYPDFQKKECYCLGDPRLTRYILHPFRFILV